MKSETCAGIKFRSLGEMALPQPVEQRLRVVVHLERQDERLRRHYETNVPDAVSAAGSDAGSLRVISGISLF